MATLGAVQSSCAFASPNYLARALQRELAALASLEADYHSACRWLDEWAGPEAVKEDVACRLEARHRREREAHVLRLADLHQKRMVLAIAEPIEPTNESHSSVGANLSQSKLPRLLPPAWVVSSPNRRQAGSTASA